MGNPDDKIRHSKRIKAKKREALKKSRVRSVIAKELIVSGKYTQRIILDKRGRKHDLDRMTFLDLVEAIQED